MSGRVFKLCGCRENGKQLGAKCPRLRSKGHGTWAYVVDDGKGETGRRKQVKRAGFATKKDSVTALEEARGDIKAGRRLNDKTTVGEWLDHWLAEKSSTSGVSSSGRILRESTRAVYAQHIHDYLRPTLGQVRLRQLSPDDISKAYRRILESNGRIGPTTLRRIHACLSSALNRAVKARLISYNPCASVDLPDATRPQVKPWEPWELGRYLDHSQGHRMGTLFEVIAAGGLRRGEALGLTWADVDLERGVLTIRQQLLDRWQDGHPVFGPPKTAAGENRTVELDSTTLGSLLAHQLQQDAERAAWGSAYEGYNLVFARENGAPYDPSAVTKTFTALTKEAGLRRVRLHDLRHGAASLMLAAGIPLELVSKRLGHSSINITHSTYQHLLEDVGRGAAEKAMGLVPRNPKAPAVTTP